MKELLLIGLALIALPAIIFVSLRLYELNGGAAAIAPSHGNGGADGSTN